MTQIDIDSNPTKKANKINISLTFKFNRLSEIQPVLLIWKMTVILWELAREAGWDNDSYLIFQLSSLWYFLLLSLVYSVI